MKQDYTHITILLDRSGSMESIRQDTIGGFNTFLQTHREQPGHCTVSIVQFNDHYLPHCWFSVVHGVSPLNTKTYVPAGTTALLDALSASIDQTGRALKCLAEQERPAKVLFVIITDGQENASHHTTRAEVLAKIKHQTDAYKWEFVYIGANQDAIGEAQGMGISAANAMNYTANAQGTESLYRSVADNSVRFRSGATASCAFSEDDIKAQDAAKQTL